MAAPFSFRAIAQIDACLETHLKTNPFSGNVIVAKGPEASIVRSYGLANQEHRVANTAHTKFRIGSVTKQMTAAVVLQLQDHQLLNIEAPVSAYLPDYPEGHRITLHHLLTHTAGIPDYLSAELFPNIEDWLRLPATLDQLVDRFKDLPLTFHPGKAFMYSNSGYILLTKIIETVTGEPYADCLQTRLFEPLGMAHTGYEIPGAVIPNLAQGYLFVDDNTYLSAAPIDMSLPQGAGGVYSTVGDLALWHQWLHGDPTHQTLLSPKLIDAIKQPVIAIDLEQEWPDAFYGYGLVHDTYLDQPLIHHDGKINGFGSSLAYCPHQNLTVGVLSNMENSAPEALAKALLQELLETA
ncbi:MAG: serine hydrolase domain-containing protein [Cyanobacteria bacterium P01_A01_bin.116]